MKFPGELQFELHIGPGWHWDCATNKGGYVRLRASAPPVLADVSTDILGSHVNMSMPPRANNVSMFCVVERSGLWTIQNSVDLLPPVYFIRGVTFVSHTGLCFLAGTITSIDDDAVRSYVCLGSLS